MGETRSSDAVDSRSTAGYRTELLRTLWYGLYEKRLENSVAFRGSPYSGIQVAPESDSVYRTMSSRGTATTAAPKSSGRCVIAAPTRSPPFDPPSAISWAGVVTFVAI